MVVGMDLLNEVTGVRSGWSNSVDWRLHRSEGREGEPVLFTQKGASTCPCPCVAWPCGL